MSANLDLVRSIYVDWERRDFSRADWADPEIEFEVADGPDMGLYKGVAPMAKVYGEFLSAFDGYRWIASEYRKLDDERILVSGHPVGGHAKLSGLRGDDDRDHEPAEPPRGPVLSARGKPLFRPRRKGEEAGSVLRPRPRFADLGLKG